MPLSIYVFFNVNLLLAQKAFLNILIVKNNCLQTIHGHPRQPSIKHGDVYTGSCYLQLVVGLGTVFKINQFISLAGYFVETRKIVMTFQLAGFQQKMLIH